jgi:hypothetical protein
MHILKMETVGSSKKYLTIILREDEQEDDPITDGGNKLEGEVKKQR